MKHDNDNLLLESREEAQAAGLRHYRPSAPCRCGQVVVRYTSTGACVPCAIARARDRYANNIEAKKEYDAKRYKENPTARTNSSRWRVENPEKMRECREKWKANNPEKHKESQRKWSRNNPESIRCNTRARRSRKRGAEGSHTAKDVSDILARQNYKCVECKSSVRKSSSRHVDHIVPLALGGSNWPSNLQILCARCNRQKGCKDPINFAMSKGRLF